MHHILFLCIICFHPFGVNSQEKKQEEEEKQDMEESQETQEEEEKQDMEETQEEEEYQDEEKITMGKILDMIKCLTSGMQLCLS